MSSSRPRVLPLSSRTAAATPALAPVQHALAPAGASARELWLCAFWPQLALESLRLESQSGPVAVIELAGSAHYIVALNEPAARAGVRVGSSWAAASALARELTTREREPHRERALLEELARLAQRYSPRVTLEPPDALLIEVKGSLRLFGGLAQLYRRFRGECRAAGTAPQLALAPTPLAALAGARSGQSFLVMQPARLVGALAPLPLSVLRWPLPVLERLAKAGVHTVGEVLRLPRAGFARRFGIELMTLLDRLVGRQADPRCGFQAPERFRARRDFAYEVSQHESLLCALDPLLAQLARFLAVRQCGITALECRLRHARAPETRCLLRLAAPTADQERLRALLAERLATSSLPEPARSGELRSGEPLPLALAPASLWQPGEHGGGSGATASDLLERLRARLGFEAVHGLAVHPTHRPEAASRHTDLSLPTHARAASRSIETAPWAAGHRPLWLLPRPELLAERDGLPRHRGPLRLLGEPERIETGWWEADEVARDYYPALDSRGVRLWIYRERVPPHRWFLHGLFG